MKGERKDRDDERLPRWIDTDNVKDKPALCMYVLAR